MVCVSTTTFAQQKFLHIEFAALLKLMPEKAQAQAELGNGCSSQRNFRGYDGRVPGKMESFKLGLRTWPSRFKN